MAAKRFRVIIQVPDIESAARFYAAVLGGAGRRVSPGRHYFDCGGTILACVDPGAEGDPESAAPNVDYLYLAVDDLEAEAQRLSALGVALPMPPTRQPWGGFLALVADPDGNVLYLDEVAAAHG